jgi:hypothetical protein
MKGVSARGRAERRQKKTGSDWIYGERAQPSEQSISCEQFYLPGIVEAKIGARLAADLVQCMD